MRSVFLSILLSLASVLYVPAQTAVPTKTTVIPKTTLNAAFRPVVQICQNTNFAATVTCGNFTRGTLTSGHMLVAFGNASAGVTLTTTVIGCGLTWTTVNSNTTTGTHFFATAPITSTATCTGASRPTISGTGSSGDIGIDVSEVISLSQTVDGTPVYSVTTASSNFTGPSLTTLVSRDTVLNFMFVAAANPQTNNWAISSPDTPLFGPPASALGYVQINAFQVQQTAGAVNANYIYAGGLSTPIRGEIAIEP